MRPERRVSPPDPPKREGSVTLEILGCAVAAILLTAVAYALTRFVAAWIGVG